MENEEPLISNPIDQITLDFLMNRKQYKKYVAKNDPMKHFENEEHLQKIWKYRNRISEMTDNLLKNPETMITLDVNQAFDRYMRTLIRYFEMKELEKKDIDVLFDDMDDEEEKYRTSIAENTKIQLEHKMALVNVTDQEHRESTTKSYWGKETVKKTQSMADFFLHNRKHK
jgi:hypothetical protein